MYGNLIDELREVLEDMQTTLIVGILLVINLIV